METIDATPIVAKKWIKGGGFLTEECHPQDVFTPEDLSEEQQQVAKIGSFQATVDEEKTAQIPVAATAALLLVGLALVLVGSRSKS